MHRSGVLAYAVLVVLSFLVLLNPSLAVEPDEMLADPALEQRAREISSGLRCVVCQNQSIDESNAPLAKDLRLLVRERLKSGATDEEVVDYVVARYGEFVLLRPRFGQHTLLLWLTPLIVLMGAVGLAILVMRRAQRATETSTRPLSADEQAALDKILKQAQRDD